MVVHELTWRHLADRGVQQKKAYDLQCMRQDFAAGAQLWVYSPVRKKEHSPKLTSHWVWSLYCPGEPVGRSLQSVDVPEGPGCTENTWLPTSPWLCTETAPQAAQPLVPSSPRAARESPPLYLGGSSRSHGD